eukprot:gene22344-biopygen5737
MAMCNRASFSTCLCRHCPTYYLSLLGGLLPRRTPSPPRFCPEVTGRARKVTGFKRAREAHDNAWSSPPWEAGRCLAPEGVERHRSAERAAGLMRGSPLHTTAGRCPVLNASDATVLRGGAWHHKGGSAAARRRTSAGNSRSRKGRGAEAHQLRTETGASGGGGDEQVTTVTQDRAKRVTQPHSGPDRKRQCVLPLPLFWPGVVRLRWSVPCGVHFFGPVKSPKEDVEPLSVGRLSYCVVYRSLRSLCESVLPCPFRRDSASLSGGGGNRKCPRHARAMPAPRPRQCHVPPGLWIQSGCCPRSLGGTRTLVQESVLPSTKIWPFWTGGPGQRPRLFTHQG